MGLYTCINGGALYPGRLISGTKKCSGMTKSNVSEKQIKANIPLHIELHL